MQSRYPPASFRTILSASAWTIVLVCLVAGPASAAGNTPCSGRKGGIDHCQGERFICRDGSISASETSCAATHRPLGLLGTSPQPAPVTSAPATGTTSCDCRSGTFCTGPRGGRFCLSDSGVKSYLRK
ncbi:hypothetical protein [Rhizobium sp. Leaf371]|uniref:hypothetical protein n=1 Tax=Rhizobium sp. Leaf371 TaxID=1736355 RepID=UPI0009E8A00A|nr:hypothetical protein [Rhizobium sp. Leaf371]